MEDFKDYTVSSGNVFQDMGFPDSEERLAKAKLAAVINKIVEEKGLSQEEASKILNIDQSEIPGLKKGRLNEFSLERLFLFLEALDQNIEITITPKSKVKAIHRINVAYA